MLVDIVGHYGKENCSPLLNRDIGFCLNPVVSTGPGCTFPKALWTLSPSILGLLPSPAQLSQYGKFSLVRLILYTLNLSTASAEGFGLPASGPSKNSSRPGHPIDMFALGSVVPSVSTSSPAAF